MKETDLIELKNGMWVDRLTVIERLRSLGLEPPRRKRKWWEFWK